ncbi:MAG: CysB family HTH-type transcriptional regulator [Burkholderiaceae bacterium]|nr:CysB family HTH-type transcriptional regulator [Burkholderiaceae bacterium]
MNFQQLRIVKEAARRDFNLTEVSNALFTSQSGVSKHIRDLEDELGIEIFVRKGKRLLGLTEPGKELLALVERVLLDTRNIKELAERYHNVDHGQLTIATTHTQARYALPKIVTAFKQAYPKVHLTLHQGSPKEIVELLRDGQADIGIATETISDVPEFAAFPFYSWYHTVVVPKGHPLEDLKKITLESLIDYPIVTYHEGFTGRGKIDQTFAEAGLSPDIVMSALDADVIKTYVELGLGIGIIASMAYQPQRDQSLHQVDISHLFPGNTTYIALRRGQYLRGYVHHFLHLASPELTEQRIREATAPIQEDNTRD